MILALSKYSLTGQNIEWNERHPAFIGCTIIALILAWAWSSEKRN